MLPTVFTKRLLPAPPHRLFQNQKFTGFAGSVTHLFCLGDTSHIEGTEGPCTLQKLLSFHPSFECPVVYLDTKGIQYNASAARKQLREHIESGNWICVPSTEKPHLTYIVFGTRDVTVANTLSLGSFSTFHPDFFEIKE